MGLGQLTLSFYFSKNAQSLAKGLTQKQLTSMAGLEEKQIQRYEAWDYANVDQSRV